MITWYSCLMLNSGLTIAFGILYTISEYLGQNPNIKANTVYQLIYNFLFAVVNKNKSKGK